MFTITAHSRFEKIELESNIQTEGEALHLQAEYKESLGIEYTIRLFRDLRK